MSGEAANPVAARPAGSPARLVLTLGGAGVLAGVILVFAFQATEPAIRRNKEAALERAVAEVLRGPERFETLYVNGGALQRDPPAGVKPADLERVFLGYRGGRPAGFAFEASGPGFQDTVALIVGYDAAKQQLLAMKVLSSKETPGLGDVIEKNAAWVAGFEGAAVPLLPVKAGSGSGASGEVDTITGATISSKAVIRIINGALARLQPLLERYQKEVAP